MQAVLLDDDSSVHRLLLTEQDLNRRLRVPCAFTSCEGVTALHICAEFNCIKAARVLLQAGADVNAPANIDTDGFGGQTPIFHAVTQYGDWGLPVAQLLMERGADLSVRAKLPGHYERPGEVVECTPLGYALRFPGGENKTVTMLRERGAAE